MIFVRAACQRADALVNITFATCISGLLQSKQGSEDEPSHALLTKDSEGMGVFDVIFSFYWEHCQRAIQSTSFSFSGFGMKTRSRKLIHSFVKRSA